MENSIERENVIVDAESNAKLTEISVDSKRENGNNKQDEHQIAEQTECNTSESSKNTKEDEDSSVSKCQQLHSESAQNTVDMLEAVSSTQSASSSSSIDNMLLQADSLYSQEKYEESAEVYANILELMTATSTDPLELSLAPLYFKYGKSLFFVGQQEIFTKAAENASAALSNAVEEASSSSSAAKCVIETAQEEVDEEEESDISTEEAEATNAVEAVPADVDENDDLKVAWEALDTARLIYSKQPVECIRNELSDVYLALGDVSMESGAFQQATQDYLQSLTLLQSSSNETASKMRIIAECFYKIALSHEYANDYDKARENIQKSLELLRSVRDASENDAERKDLEELLPELEGKLEDLSNGNQPVNLSSLVNVGSSSTAENTSDAAVTDISSMIKRKQPLQTHAAGNDGESEKKREKLENGV